MSGLTLEIDGLQLGYGDITAVWDASFSVATGRLCAIVGRNGAGKSTLCKGIAGLLKVQQGAIAFEGESITRLPPWERAARGLALVQEGKRIFRDLTVQENLELGLCAVRLPRRIQKDRIETVYGTFPILGARRKENAGQLSGGQQQMLAVGQALVPEPRLLIVDEPSSGLAPVVVEEILSAVAVLKSAGKTIMMVEQLELIADIADDVVALESGKVMVSAKIGDINVDALAANIYLGES